MEPSLIAHLLTPQMKQPQPHFLKQTKRARACDTFTDSKESAIVEFVKQHRELYDKENGRFHDIHRKEDLWAEISAELKLQRFDARR